MQRIKKLSVAGLIIVAKKTVKKSSIESILGNRKCPITIDDVIMSALAMFGLKYPSLLQFNKDSVENSRLQHNLKMLYGVNHVPSDTYMRERLDEIDPRELRKIFKAMFASVQRGKELESFRFMDGHYLVSMDGTGFFSSSKIRCYSCNEKKHRDGTTTYYHQMFLAAIVHPNRKTVLPFAPEPISNKDGNKKNDCEFNAIKRLITDLRREHPHLKIIVTADSLHANAPTITLLRENNMSFILSAKPGNHKTLFQMVDGYCETFKYKSKDNSTYKVRYINSVPINETNSHVTVNFLDCEVTDRKGKKTKFSFVTNIPITQLNIPQLIQGGRARWKIENETFNTLKNLGYQFEHNFGHGYKNLSTVFCMLMVLAFLMDQIQEHCDRHFQQALAKVKRKSYLWRRMRSFFDDFKVNSWDDMWDAIAFGIPDIELSSLSGP